MLILLKFAQENIIWCIARLKNLIKKDACLLTSNSLKVTSSGGLKGPSILWKSVKSLFCCVLLSREMKQVFYSLRQRGYESNHHFRFRRFVLVRVDFCLKIFGLASLPWKIQWFDNYGLLLPRRHTTIPLNSHFTINYKVDAKWELKRRTK